MRRGLKAPVIATARRHSRVSATEGNGPRSEKAPSNSLIGLTLQLCPHTLLSSRLHILLFLCGFFRSREELGASLISDDPVRLSTTLMLQLDLFPRDTRSSRADQWLFNGGWISTAERSFPFRVAFTAIDTGGMNERRIIGP